MKMIAKQLLSNILFTATTAGAVCGAVSIINNHYESTPSDYQVATVGGTESYSAPRATSRIASSTASFDNAMSPSSPTDVSSGSSRSVSAAPAGGTSSGSVTPTGNFSGSLNSGKTAFGRTSSMAGSGSGGGGGSTGVLAVARPFSGGSHVAPSSVGEFMSEGRPDVGVQQKVNIGGGGKDEPFYEPLDGEVWCLLLCAMAFAVTLYIKRRICKVQK